MSRVTHEGKEWNVFSPDGLTKRKSTARSSFVRVGTADAQEACYPQGGATGTIIQGGQICDSPPCSPSTMPKAPFFSARASEVRTGQVVSIAAANDAQLAMEYPGKGKGDNGMKSLTSVSNMRYSPDLRFLILRSFMNY